MLIKCTGLAISQGGSARSGFEDACASSFGAANSGGTITPLALSMTDCILSGRGFGWSTGKDYSNSVSIVDRVHLHAGWIGRCGDMI